MDLSGEINNEIKTFRLIRRLHSLYFSACKRRDAYGSHLSRSDDDKPAVPEVRGQKCGSVENQYAGCGGTFSDIYESD